MRVEFSEDAKRKILTSVLGELTQEEANKFLKANSWELRKYAVKYADKQSKLDQLLVEKNFKVVNTILDSIGELTQGEAKELLKANSCGVREYAVKYADKQSKVEQLLVEENFYVVEKMLRFINELTKEEANKLLKANSCEVREYAAKYADKQSKLDQLLVEEDFNVIHSILTSIGDVDKG